MIYKVILCLVWWPFLMKRQHRDLLFHWHLSDWGYQAWYPYSAEFLWALLLLQTADLYDGDLSLCLQWQHCNFYTGDISWEDEGCWEDHNKSLDSQAKPIRIDSKKIDRAMATRADISSVISLTLHLFQLALHSLAHCWASGAVLFLVIISTIFILQLHHPYFEVCVCMFVCNCNKFQKQIFRNLF